MNKRWQPTATLSTLKKRARLLADTRHFFDSRGFMEVDTPLLAPFTVTDPHIHSFETRFYPHGCHSPETLYLQTSPEFAMKRLLAAGSGPIYQLGKVFRNSDSGSRHSPEFTMLEWYQPGLDHHGLMDEMDAYLQTVASQNPAKRISFQALFEQCLNLDPHRCSIADLVAKADSLGCSHWYTQTEASRQDWLDLLLAQVIEPQLKALGTLFVYDYPACHAALARLRQEQNHAVAERFEVYINGVELANGFHELTDPSHQAQRFTADQTRRGELGYAIPEQDPHFLSALEHGLPACAGVALGIDRLLMLITEAQTIDQVIPFSTVSL